MTRVQQLQQMIVQVHRALCAAADVGADNFQVGSVVELDRQVAAILTELATQPAMKMALQRELAALQRSHARLREQCQHKCQSLKQAMIRHNNNKEGLMAYQEAEL